MTDERRRSHIGGNRMSLIQENQEDKETGRKDYGGRVRRRRRTETYNVSSRGNRCRLCKVLRGTYGL